jgi:hypothetical protein
VRRLGHAALGEQYIQRSEEIQVHVLHVESLSRIDCSLTSMQSIIAPHASGAMNFPLPESGLSNLKEL